MDKWPELKRLGIAFGGSWVNHIGQVVDGFRLISTQYGNCGMDSRRNVVQQLVDVDLDMDEFKKKYELDEELIKLREKINEYTIRYRDITNFTKTKKVGTSFTTGFHYDQFIESLVG
jgi:hypothetical protein